MSTAAVVEVAIGATTDPDKALEECGRSFEENYELDETLGEGMFSVVRSGFHKETKETFAIKVITRAKMQDFDKKCLADEIKILSELNHERIIRLYDVFYAPEHIYLVTEKVLGGELFSRLVQKEQYTEAEVRDVCKILFQAVAHCHEHKVAHRDLKPENLLLQSLDDDTSIKIADFGFAKQVKGGDNKSLKTQCGSPGHVAPEILERVPYNTQCDVWSLAVIAYTLLAGYPPFQEESLRDQFQKIRSAEYSFPASEWENISQDAKDMIASCLVADPDNRKTCQDILKNNRWIAVNDAKVLRRSSLMNNLHKLHQSWTACHTATTGGGVHHKNSRSSSILSVHKFKEKRTSLMAGVGAGVDLSDILKFEEEEEAIEEQDEGDDEQGAS